MKRQIIALGGGGFSMEPRNRRLDSYILSQATPAQLVEQIFELASDIFYSNERN